MPGNITSGGHLISHASCRVFISGAGRPRDLNIGTAVGCAPSFPPGEETNHCHNTRRYSFAYRQIRSPPTPGAGRGWLTELGARGSESQGMLTAGEPGDL